MYIYYNPNPLGKQVGDCTIRALTIFLNKSWDEVYDDLCAEGKLLADMPSGNTVWASYLRKRGYVSVPLVNTCPDCFTVYDFCRRNKTGRFLLSIGNHVVTVVNGDHYDSWDSGNEVPVYYWVRKGEPYADIWK